MKNEDDLRVIFDQWPKLHLGLDALSNQKILKGIYYLVGLTILHVPVLCGYLCAVMV